MVDFAGHRGGDNAAVITGKWQELQRLCRQAFGFFRFTGVDRHLCAQGVKFGLQGAIDLNFLIAHRLFGAFQQGVHFAVAVLALCQPGLQQRQFGILDQPFIRQRIQTLFQQG
ncbi:hypothetical protein D3C80_1746420 [compost metagenome]